MKNYLQHDTIEYVKMVTPEDLKPGDMWLYGLNQKIWILISKKESKIDWHESHLKTWEMVWFGQKGNSNKLEIIVDNWIDGSKFKIFSYDNKE